MVREAPDNSGDGSKPPEGVVLEFQLAFLLKV